MLKAEFELEAITPVFMRGANQSRAEIRATSIKGVMRWWFRALAGSYFGDDVEGLRKAEEYVFGSTKQRSKVSVEINNIKSEERYVPENEFGSYFWFSQVSKFPKPALQPNTIFNATIKGYNELAVKIAVMSLWLAIHLGGFGSRARKFAGSIFTVREPHANFDIDFDFLPDAKRLRDYYTKTFTTLFENMSNILRSLGFKKGNFNSATYPILSQKTAHVFIGERVSSPGEAIKNVGLWYLGEYRGRKFEGGFRFKHADRGLVSRIYRKYLEGSERIGNIKAKNERRPYLGLPIQFYRKFDGEFVRFTVDHWDANRRASSLIMTVNKIGDEYYPVITVLKYSFLPNYKGPVRYSGGIYKRKSKIAHAGGAIFILDKDEDPKAEYESFYEDLIDSLRSHFTEVFP